MLNIEGKVNNSASVRGRLLSTEVNAVNFELKNAVRSLFELDTWSKYDEGDPDHNQKVWQLQKTIDTWGKLILYQDISDDEHTVELHRKVFRNKRDVTIKDPEQLVDEITFFFVGRKANLSVVQLKLNQTDPKRLLKKVKNKDTGKNELKDLVAGDIQADRLYLVTYNKIAADQGYFILIPFHSEGGGGWGRQEVFVDIKAKQVPHNDNKGGAGEEWLHLKTNEDGQYQKTEKYYDQLTVDVEAHYHSQKLSWVSIDDLPRVPVILYDEDAHELTDIEIQQERYKTGFQDGFIYRFVYHSPSEGSETEQARGEFFKAHQISAARKELIGTNPGSSYITTGRPDSIGETHIIAPASAEYNMRRFTPYPLADAYKWDGSNVQILWQTCEKVRSAYQHDVGKAYKFDKLGSTHANPKKSLNGTEKGGVEYIERGAFVYYNGNLDDSLVGARSGNHRVFEAKYSAALFKKGYDPNQRKLSRYSMFYIPYLYSKGSFLNIKSANLKWNLTDTYKHVYSFYFDGHRKTLHEITLLNQFMHLDDPSELISQGEINLNNEKLEETVNSVVFKYRSGWKRFNDEFNFVVTKDMIYTGKTKYHLSGTPDQYEAQRRIFKPFMTDNITNYLKGNGFVCEIYGIAQETRVQEVKSEFNFWRRGEHLGSQYVPPEMHFEYEVVHVV